MKHEAAVDTGDDLVPVVALCLRDRQGRILAQRRPASRSWAGFWEFPGGKVQPGETKTAALEREVREELGIRITGLDRFCHRTLRTQDFAVALDFFTARRFSGHPSGREGQEVEWLAPEALVPRPWLPADRPVVTRLALGDFCGVTPRLTRAEPGFIEAGFRQSLERGLRFIRVRFASGVGESSIERASLQAWARDRGILLALEPAEGDPGARVVHLRSDQARRLDVRPVPDEVLLGASCHDEWEIEHASRLPVDYLFLGHVASTPMHPGTPGLGWETWSRLAARSDAPVYAIGGLGPADLARARTAGAAGVAGIRAFWKMP